MLTRLIRGQILSSKKSILLLGPRQVGKSTLLQSLNPDLTINLADQEVYLQFASNPGELRSRVESLDSSKPTMVFVDEVQRVATLLNTVQAIVDERKKIRFLLSGSSARKLRRGNANLLPGRIHTYNLGPIISAEADYLIDSKKALTIGTLPGIMTDEDSSAAQKTLRSYAATYLKEEIQAESLSRNLEGFARFLKVVASWSATLADYSKVASQAMISRQSVARYFEILEDTLIFHRIDAFSNSPRRKLIQHPKFYLFDVGVLNGLLDNFVVSSDRIGVLFETLIVSQILASLSARDLSGRLSFFLTEGGAEVDLILEMGTTVHCIEVKSATNITDLDTRGFESFKKFYNKPFNRYIFYAGKDQKTIKEVSIMPWQSGLKAIGL